MMLGARPASASPIHSLRAGTARASASTTDGAQRATKGTPPSGLSGCIEEFPVEICFQKHGDKIWVKNNSLTTIEYGHYSNWLRDNNSNWVFWRNGDCRVEFTGWGYCDKDFYEDGTKNARHGYGSGVRLYPCDSYSGCSSYYSWVRNNA
jgi:hypothetical protein